MTTTLPQVTHAPARPDLPPQRRKPPIGKTVAWVYLVLFLAVTIFLLAAVVLRIGSRDERT